jgi:hypothetical protein
METQWAGVLAWAAEKQEESLHLEFKAKDRDNPVAMTAKDWGQLAQAMSAFANAEGGVFVFGVHAMSQAKNFPDQVRSIIPLGNLLSFTGAIQKMIHQLTDPPIAGVQVEPIKNPENLAEGIIVIYVPQSDGGPHRAAKGTNDIADRYYMRSALSSIPMHHTLLAEQFGRRPMPQLYLAVQIHGLTSTRWSAKVWIGNKGRGYAERLAIGFAKHPDLKQPDPQSGFCWHSFLSNFGPENGWDRVILPGCAKDGTGCILRARADIVLYPGMEVLLGFIQMDERNPSSLLLSIHGTLYAMNTQPVRFSLVKALPTHVDDSAGSIERIEMPSPSREDLL